MEKLKRIIIYANIFSLLNVSFSYGAEKDYPLIDAVRDNSMRKTTALIDKYDVNMKDGNKNTALSYAVYNDNFEITRLLLRNGATAKIKDSSGRYIYCAGQTSDDAKIKKLFEKYDSSKCGKVVAAKQQKLNVSPSRYSIDWRYVGGGVLGAGAIVAIAALANDSSGSGGGGGGGNRFSPADRNYGIVGEVNATTLNNILNNTQYNKTWALTDSGGNPVNRSNQNSFNDIRLAYSLARGYTGRVTDISGITTPYYLTPGSTTTNIPINTKIKVAVLDTGVQLNHSDFSDGSGGWNIPQLGDTLLQNSNLAYAYCQDPLYAGTTACTLSSYAQNNPAPSSSDSTAWHGTFVAGLIGASYSNGIGITGVAPNSQILPYRITLDDGDFVSDYYLGQAFASATAAGASVINNSYGTPTNVYGINIINASKSYIETNTVDITRNYLYYYFGDKTTIGTYNPTIDYSNTTNYGSNYITQMLAALANDVVFVWAAGNEGNSQPSVESAMPLYFSEFTNGDYIQNFIAVVAYDSDSGTIASYSNRCGVAKNYCLTAPGTNLVSTITGDDYGTSSGTSFAAPLVSGAVAVLKGAFPYLTGAEITKILFITARDLGDPGVDEVYGWGMLDMERATRPVGATLVPIDSRVGTAGFSLTASTMQLSSSLAKKIQSKDLDFVILDSFNRTFTMKLNDFVEADKYEVRTIDILKKFGENKPRTFSMNGDSGFGFYFAGESEASPYGEVEFSYSANGIYETNYGFNIYYGNNPYNAFVGNKVDLYSNFSLSNSYNYNILNPYFRTDSDINFGFNNVIKISEKVSLNFGLLYQSYTMNYDEVWTSKRKRNEDVGTAFSMLSGFSYAFSDNVSAKIETGFLNEFDTLMGSKLNGAFGIGQNNLTYMVGLQNDINLGKKISIFGRANFGYTTVNNAENTLIKNVSGILSNSFSIGLNYNFESKLKGEKSNISLLLMQPVRIISGDLDIALPVARDMDGNLYYSRHKIGLTDDSSLNIQLAYNRSFKTDSSFGLGFIYKDEYGENDYVLLLKYRKAFGL